MPRQSLATRGAVVIAAVKPGADVVTPPLKGQVANVHHVAVLGPRPVKQSVNTEVAQSTHNLGQGFVIS
jgi:hypothetical protein